jgi:hypothetical protein
VFASSTAFQWDRYGELAAKVIAVSSRLRRKVEENKQKINIFIFYNAWSMDTGMIKSRISINAKSVPSTPLPLPSIASSFIIASQFQNRESISRI